VSKGDERVSQEDFVRVCEFLAKEGYLDDDWWCEQPTALERYKQALLGKEL